MRQVTQILRESLNRVDPELILIHAGINNVSKNHLYSNEYHQLQSTADDIGSLASSIAEYEKSFPDVRVILSFVTATRDGWIDEK